MKTASMLFLLQRVQTSGHCLIVTSMHLRKQQPDDFSLDARCHLKTNSRCRHDCPWLASFYFEASPGSVTGFTRCTLVLEIGWYTSRCSSRNSFLFKLHQETYACIVLDDLVEFSLVDMRSRDTVETQKDETQNRSRTENMSRNESISTVLTCILYLWPRCFIYNAGGINYLIIVGLSLHRHF